LKHRFRIMSAIAIPSDRSAMIERRGIVRIQLVL